MNFCKLLSIVIPCFNEEPVILKTLSDLYQELSNLISQNTISDFELIFVDDGSKDATLSILKEESTKNSKIKVIALSRNFGHQLALMAGLKNATGDAVISMDADLQDPIYLIGEMVKKINAGADIVFGVRNNRENDTIFKKKSAQFFYKIMKFFGVTIIEEPIVVKGTAGGAAKVVVNGYTLQQFVPSSGSEPFTYRISENNKNLQKGENVYEVYTVAPDGEKSKSAFFKIIYEPKPMEIFTIDGGVTTEE